MPADSKLLKDLNQYSRLSRKKQKIDHAPFGRGDFTGLITPVKNLKSTGLDDDEKANASMSSKALGGSFDNAGKGGDDFSGGDGSFQKKQKPSIERK